MLDQDRGLEDGDERVDDDRVDDDRVELGAGV